MGNFSSKLTSPDEGCRGDSGLRLHPLMMKVTEVVTDPGPLPLTPLSTPCPGLVPQWPLIPAWFSQGGEWSPGSHSSAAGVTGQKGRLEPGLCSQGLSPSWGREGSPLPAPLGGEGCAVGAGGPALTPRGWSQGHGRPARPLPPPGTSRCLSSEPQESARAEWPAPPLPSQPRPPGRPLVQGSPPVTPVLAPAGGSCPIHPSGPLSTGSCSELPPLPSA